MSVIKAVGLGGALVASCAWGLGGCSDASSSSAPVDDAGSDGGATVVRDGGGADSRPAVGQVTVEVLEDRRPRPGVKILFHDEDGAIADEASTDASGRVVRSPTPSAVTILDEYTSLTFLAVADGDVLRVRGLTFRETADGRRTARYDVSLPGPVAGATGYDVLVGRCIDIATDATVPFRIDARPTCATTASGVLAKAFVPAGPSRFAWKTGLAPVGTSVAPVQLGPWTDAQPLALQWDTTKGPPGAKYRAEIFGLLADGEAFPLPVATPVDVSLDRPVGFAVAQHVTLTTEDEARNRYVSQTVVAPTASAVTLGAGDVSRCPAAAVETRTDGRAVVSWPQPSPAPKSAYFLSVVLNSGPSRPPSSWQIVAPPTKNEVKLPELPASFGRPDVAAVSMLDSDALDYAAVRRTPTFADDLSSVSALLPPTVGLRSRAAVCRPAVR